MSLAPVGVDQEVRGLGPLQCDRGAEHGTGQAHPADGGPEQLGCLAVRRQGADLAVGHQQVEGDHVVAEAALGVVVLAVHVGGDRAADRDLPGARQHRDPQAERQHRPHQQIQADARLHRHGGRLVGGVEGQDPVHPGQVHRRAARVLGGVAVAAPEPARHHPATVGGAQGRDGIGDGVDLRQVRHGPGGPAPAVQLDQWLRDHRLVLGQRGPDRRNGCLAHRKNTAREITTSHTTPMPCRT